MIFVTGDCHGNFERFKPKYFPEQAQMTKRDICDLCRRLWWCVVWRRP